MKKKKIKLTSNISQRQYDKLLKALFNRIKSDEKCFIKLSNSLEYQQKRWELAEQKLVGDYRMYDSKLKLFVKANKELKKENTKLVKANFELTRAYNGMAHMCKTAKESGIDIEKYRKQLPEYQSQYTDFEQKHEVLESGKVRSTYTAKRKK